MADPASTSYDEIPYIKAAFPQTHPDRMATLATIFGLRPPEIETCRVLELGCAGGDNLIPMAMGLPDARFVGIDLSHRQIGQGLDRVAALGLSNIELRRQDIADVDASWGVFDYIVCHGIYSWVPAPVRERILAICRDNLAADGIAYVSYNTLPGWHIRGMIRDMMIYHAAAFPDAATKVRQARGLLDFLAQSVPTTLPYGMTLRQELDAIRREPDAYLFHDHLEEVNEPVYFHQFVEAAQRYELEYLAEAEFGAMLVSSFPVKVAETLRRVATDIVRMEQYMDFVRNRMFRQTLLVRRGAAIRRNLDGRAVRDLLVASPAEPVSAQPVWTDGVTETFRTPSGATHNIADGLTKAALLLLGKQWPQCLPFEQIAAMSRASLGRESGGTAGTAPNDDDDRRFGDRMLQGYAARAIELRWRSPRLSPVPSARPVASPLARLQAAQGATVTNLRHEPVTLPDLARRMLPLLDGSRDIEALVAEFAKIARDGKIGVREQESGPIVTDPASQERILRQTIAASLPMFARTALLLE